MATTGIEKAYESLSHCLAAYRAYSESLQLVFNVWSEHGREFKPARHAKESVKACKAALAALRKTQTDSKVVQELLEVWIVDCGDQDITLGGLRAASLAEAILAVCHRAVDRKIGPDKIDWTVEDARKDLAKDVLNADFDELAFQLRTECRQMRRSLNLDAGWPGRSSAKLWELCTSVGLSLEDFWKLPRRSRRLLKYLLRHRGMPISFEDLGDDVWCADKWRPGTIRQGVMQLRKDLVNLDEKYKSLAAAINKDEDGYGIGEV